jgi:hypothetical protein
MNIITLQDIQDNIVAPSTLRNYVTEANRFLCWSFEHQPDWLTLYGKDQVATIKTSNSHGRTRGWQHEAVKKLMQKAKEEPFLDLEFITPKGFMKFLLDSRDRYMSESTYNNRRSSLNHLFRCHNGSGFPNGFESELSTLFRGFTRILARHPRRQQRRIGQAWRMMNLTDHQENQQDNEMCVNEDNGGEVEVEDWISGRDDDGNVQCQWIYTNHFVVGCWRMVHRKECLLIASWCSAGIYAVV